MSVTSLQMSMIERIALDEFTPVNGAIPEDVEHASTWADCVIETPQDKGVFTSLLNAGLVWHAGKGRDAQVGLTDEGFKVFCNHSE